MTVIGGKNMTKRQLARHFAAMKDAEAHVCMACGAKGYGGWNCQQCGSTDIAMIERSHDETRS